MRIEIEIPDGLDIDFELVKQYALENALIQARERRLREIVESDEKIIEIDREKRRMVEPEVVKEQPKEKATKQKA